MGSHYLLANNDSPETIIYSEILTLQGNYIKYYILNNFMKYIRQFTQFSDFSADS